MANCVKSNPLITRSDVEFAAVQLIEPLLPQLSPLRRQLHSQCPRCRHSQCRR